MSQNEFYASVELYDVIEIVDNFIEIRANGKNTMKNIDQIEYKFIFMEINKREFVTHIPNRYEKT